MPIFNIVFVKPNLDLIPLNLIILLLSFYYMLNCALYLDSFQLLQLSNKTEVVCQLLLANCGYSVLYSQGQVSLRPNNLLY